MLIIYTIAMFVSALLLFMVEPMFARMILPLLGGAPAVWNTAVVFYQCALLAGYLYAHLTTTWLGVQRQARLHIALLLVPFLFLPISVPAGWIPPTEQNPIPWLLAVLFVAVGIPFFVVASSSPLLQKWFANTAHRDAQDPYFLYAGSNIGSIIGLLSYPFVMEEYFRLREQSWLWAGGYVLLVVLVVSCAAFVWKRSSTKPETSQHQAPPEHATPQRDKAEHLSTRRRVRWVLWAIAPSSLMLSVTTHLSTNIAAIPLLWIVPLTLYLLSFVLVFAKKPIIPHWVVVRAVGIILLPLLIIILAQATDPLWLLFPVHLIAFFIITMACHGALAQDRPSPAHLTEFYLWISVGGLLGGMFNGLLAPILFTSILEYPIMLIVVALFYFGSRKPHDGEAPGIGTPPPANKADVVLPLVLAVLMAGLIVGVQASDVVSGPVKLGVVFGIPMLFCFSFVERPVRFGLGVGAMVVVSVLLYRGDQGQVVFQERSFFGVHRVQMDAEEEHIMLIHGTTMHGMQSRDPTRQEEPLAYHYRTSPIGQVFTTLNAERPPKTVAVTGLGVGALACYSQDNQEWTFYEIDPFVEHIARDTRFFTFLHHCQPNANIVLGDARLTLAEAQGEQYDVLVLDAYSSDVLPIHLITREAMTLYRKRLAPDGIMVFHISNRYMNLKPVVGNLAHDAGLVALEQDDSAISPQESMKGKRASQWVILARDEADFGSLATDPRWQELPAYPDMAVWTDDFANVMHVLFE